MPISAARAAWRARLFRLLTVVLSAGLSLILAESLLIVFAPQPTLRPRLLFSADYGTLPAAGTTMVHACAGRYRLEYTINEIGHRGVAIPLDERDRTRNVVVLGDSNGFGMGVADGEEFPAVLGHLLGDDFAVINLSAPGWGLAQQIRRYEDLGRLYRPEVVILQFADNDVRDNLVNRVTVVEDGRLVFRDSANELNLVKKFLSRSVVQKSQVYNLLRNSIHEWLVEVVVDRASTRAEGEADLEAQRVHADLLGHFARQLADDGRALVLISSGGLQAYPEIVREIGQLESTGDLEFLDVEQWFDRPAPPPAPDGHPWGRRAHALIADGLSRWIRAR